MGDPFGILHLGEQICALSTETLTLRGNYQIICNVVVSNSTDIYVAMVMLPRNHVIAYDIPRECVCACVRGVTFRDIFPEWTPINWSPNTTGHGTQSPDAWQMVVSLSKNRIFHFFCICLSVKYPIQNHLEIFTNNGSLGAQVNRVLKASSCVYGLQIVQETTP